MWLGRTVGTTAEVRANSGSEHEHPSEGLRVSGEAESQGDRRCQRGRFVDRRGLLAAAQDHQDHDHRQKREGVEGESGLGADRRHQQSAEGRADGPGDVEGHRVERHRACHHLAGDQVGHQGLPGRQVEGGPEADQQTQGDEPLRRRLSEVGDDGHRRGRDAHDDLGDEKHLGAFDEVGDRPGDEGQAQEREGWSKRS